MDKKFWFQLFGLAVIILLATFLAFNQKFLLPLTTKIISSKTQSSLNSAEVSKLKVTDALGNLKIALKIEIVQDKETRSKGLGYRAFLASDSGMLFIHDSPSKYTYWMKGMQFPIDVMWISGEEIVDIITDIPPPIKGQSEDTLERFAPIIAVDKVLETNAGFVKLNNILKGDKIIIESTPP